MLAARPKADPDDALGWVRLMRAYTVLGETAKAKQALASARKGPLPAMPTPRPPSPLRRKH